MNPKRVGRPKQLSRNVSRAKAEIQAGDLWGEQAIYLLVKAMDSKDWTYRQLSEQLACMGVDMSPPAINRRINRGNFTAGFLLMCLEAMGTRFEVYPEDGSPQSVQPKGAGKTAKPQKPVDALEAIFDGWGAKKPSD